MFKNNPFKTFFYSITYRLATAFMGKIASRIIVLDEGTKKFSVEQYGFKKSSMTLIPHGMLNSSESITSQEAKKALNINRDCSVLLFFGRIHPRKGIEYAIKALPYVLKKYPNTRLLIAGSYSGSWKKESESYLFSLKEMAKTLDVENQVIFETRFLGKEIPTLFGASEIVLLPYSVPYGASGVLKLAATHKKTVITPNSLAREGEITDGISGVLLPSLEEKILAQKISRLLEDKNLSRKMGEKFYEENLKSSDWKKVAKKTLEYYLSI
jgi:glycosyltransferase involved in cell wall biosynthesis